MALARREFTVVDESGNIVTDAQVEVRREIAGQPLAAIYSDRDGTTPLGNPFNVDPDTGVAAFHVTGGAYKIRAFKTGFERIERYVGIGTGSETDAGLFAVAVPPTWAFDSSTADADPGDGEFRLNNATPASATAAYIDNLSFGGATITAWLDTFDDSGDATFRGYLSIFDPTAPTTVFRTYSVSGSVVDGTGYRKLTIAHLAGAGSFTAGMEYQIAFVPRGPAGPLTDIVQDTTPQLGGDLDANGHNVGFDNGTGITDDTGNEQIVFHKTASAVNQVGVTNAATGGRPKVAAEGGDTNIDLELGGKGTGGVRAPNAYSPLATLTDAATITWDGSTQQVATVTLGGSRTLGAISNPIAGATYILIVVQDGTGSRTLNLSNAIYKFPGGVEPTLSTAAGAIDVLSFIYDGTSMLGAIQKAFS
jgi:hypothetical protein